MLRSRLQLRSTLMATCLVIFVLAMVGFLIFRFYPEKILPPIFIKAEYTKLKHGEPLSDQFREIEIAGMELRVPLSYINIRLDHRRRQNAVGLRVVWSDMSSVAELHDELEYNRVFHSGGIGSILIKPKSKSSLNDIIAFKEQTFSYKKKIESDTGLDGYISYITIDQKEGRPLREIYIEYGPDGKVVGYIECTIDDGRVRYPGCDQFFQWNGLTLKLYYNKKNYLLDWRRQKEKAIGLVSSFVFMSAH